MQAAIQELLNRVLEQPKAWREVWYDKIDIHDAAHVMVVLIYNDEERVGKLTVSFLRHGILSDIGASFRYQDRNYSWPSEFLLETTTFHGDYPDMISNSQRLTSEKEADWREHVRDIVQRIKDNPEGRPRDDPFFEDGD